LADNLRSEFVSGSTPECRQAELGIRVEKGFFEDALLWMEELTNEGMVEFGLPLLDQSHFKAAVVCPVCINGDRSLNVQVVMFLPIAKSQFSLDKSFICELEVFSGAAVLSIQSTVHCRAQIEFGLQVDDVGETNIDAQRLEKLSGEKVEGM
jgi:hypothetical protein